MRLKIGMNKEKQKKNNEKKQQSNTEQNGIEQTEQNWRGLRLRRRNKRQKQPAYH